MAAEQGEELTGHASGRVGLRQWDSIEELGCRAHRRIGGLTARSDGSAKWTLHEEPPKYAPDRTCDVTHLRLELSVDMAAHAIDALARLDLNASYGPFDSIVLDAIDLEIEDVTDGSGRLLEYSYLDHKLEVRFRRKVERSAQVSIRYRKENPVQGLYFWGPTAEDPKATWQVWSQGEDEEARHWIPCHDAPHEKMTTELLVTVPRIYTVISNGALKSVEEHAGKAFADQKGPKDPGSSRRSGSRSARARRTKGVSNRRSAVSRGERYRTWHYYEAVPHSSYLISLVVGVFEKLEDECDGLPVEYYVEPGREEEGWRSFGRTPDMIRHFAELLECPFPYEKYAQVAVRRFMYGGMENTSATTQTDGTLHDKRASLDFSSDDLVAHELAHQWFGDLLTCKDWAHAWLNEGFATYFELIWKEKDLGADEFEIGLIAAADDYLSEPYRRAIVSHRFAHPFQLFDQHLYPKAAWVVHMLRKVVGDELFWKALRVYVRKHAIGSVETVDLRRAFEDATGRNLERFFDQWLFHPGHPKLEVRCSWSNPEKALQVSVTQKQSDPGSIVYELPIEVEVTLASRATPRGKSVKTTVRRVFEMNQKEQTFRWELSGRPTSVVVDPEARLLKTGKVTMPSEWIRSALLGPNRTEHVFARVHIVRAAARDARPRTVAMLAEVLRSDPFWAVQAEAAIALGRVRTPDALSGLLAHVPSHPKARRAWAQALGEFRDSAAAEALSELVRRGDVSYFVQREALESIGRTRWTSAVPLLEEELRAALRRRDWRDSIAAGAVAGLAATRSESSVDLILSVALDRTRYWSVRYVALGALAILGASRPHLAPRIAEEMVPLFEDPEHLITFRLPRAYAALGYPGAIPLLRQKAETTSNEQVRDNCLRAAEQLAGADGRGGDLDRLKSELNRLLEESRKLRERVDRLESRLQKRQTSKASR